MDKYKEQIIELAASWWANVIKDAKLDAGDDERDGAIAIVLGKMLQQPIAQEKSEMFKNRLKEYLDIEFDKCLINNGMRSIILDCDYGPDRNLSEIAKQCDISENNFPWKTTMWIGTNFCNVRYGYRHPIEAIFETKEHLSEILNEDIKALEYYEQQPDDYFVIGTREELMKEMEDKLKQDQEKYEKFIKENR